jgi:hypothetical protein
MMALILLGMLCEVAICEERLDGIGMEVDAQAKVNPD